MFVVVDGVETSSQSEFDHISVYMFGSMSLLLVNGADQSVERYPFSKLISF